MHRVRLRHADIGADASTLINLIASGELPDILRSVPARTVVVGEVQREIQCCDLQPYVDAGILILDDFEQHEYDTFVDLMGEGVLDDGEAAVGVIAISRSWAIATDDRRAWEIFRKRAPHIQVISTPELLAHWASVAHPTPVRLRRVLQLIEQEGNFQPGPRNPLYSWWMRSSTE